MLPDRTLAHFIATSRNESSLAFLLELSGTDQKTSGQTLL
jgi:hypothetical protein